MTAPLLKQAVDYMTGRCDHALALDGSGFNKWDAPLGHKLASMPEPEWSPGQRYAAWKMLGKYRDQLARGGIDYDGIVEPMAAPKNLLPRAIELSRDHFVVSWGYQDEKFDEIKALVKQTQGARWHPQSKKWRLRARLSSVDTVTRLIDSYGFQANDDIKSTMTRLKTESEGRANASKAIDAELEIPGLGGVLMPFQRAGVRYALAAKRTWIADEMGTGKTIEALATLQAADAFPALAIVPNTLKHNWLREANKWLPGRQAALFDNGDIPSGIDLLIVNYDRIFAPGQHQIGCATERKGKCDCEPEPRPALVAFKGRGLKAMILDESHFAKNYKAKRTKVVKQLARRVDMRLLLTGTPLLNRPSELIAQLGVMGRMEDVGGFWPFVHRYCGAHRTRFGLDMSGAANLKELNQILRATCLIRRTKEQVLPELPPKQRSTIPVEIDNRAEYRKAERDVVGWVADRAAEDRDFKALVAELPHAERERKIRERHQDAAYKAQQAEALVRIGALKQLAARGKLQNVIEWVGDFLESGEKLVLFAHHLPIQDALADAFSGSARLHAEDDDEARQANVDRFQDDPECKLIVCSLSVGGVGVTLTAASNVAFAELGWNPATHDQAEDRLHRIGQTDSVNAWYLMARDTIEEDVAELIESKRAVVDAAMDADAKRTAEAGIIGALMERLKERAA